MQNQKVTTAMVLDSRREKQDGEYPVKLRVTFKRVRKYYATKFSFTQNEFERVIRGKRVNESQKDLRLKVNAVEEKAIEAIGKLPLFTFQLFEKQFYSNQNIYNNIFEVYEHKINHLKNEGSVGTAIMYSCSHNSLKEFYSQDKLPYADVTVQFLKDYEKWMQKAGRSVNTISMYVRCLRTLFNDAISEGMIKSEIYPFGKNKYEVPASTNTKKALSLEDVMKIYNYTAISKAESFARDLWIFSYLANGMNVSDICRLKHTDIHDRSIIYRRAKTLKTTKTSNKPIEVPLTTELKEIIDRWATGQAQYVFPFLQQGITPTAEKKKIQQATKTINKYMARIADNLAINLKITTYFARHSFATILMRSGAPVEFISQSLGHSSTGTTQSYLGSFESKVKHEYASKLLTKQY